LLEFIWKLIVRMIPEDLREENHKEVDHPAEKHM